MVTKLDFDADFDERGLLKDGRKLHIPMLAMDAAGDHRQRLHDGHGHRPGNKPGLIIADTAARDREEAYRQYQTDIENAWRGSDAVNQGEQSEGDACTVREGGGRYGPEGSPGHLRNIDGKLVWVADRRSSSGTAIADDHRLTMDKIYAAYDAEMSNAWRGTK